jgi:hypothetical protein
VIVGKDALSQGGVERRAWSVEPCVEFAQQEGELRSDGASFAQRREGVFKQS